MARIHEAIIAISAGIDAISKDKKNAQQGFQYRGIDQFYNEIHPLFAKEGVFTTSEITGQIDDEKETKAGGSLFYRRLKIKYKFWAADGSSVESEVIGEAMDSGDKASNKAMAVAHKYALMQILTIPTEDLLDPDANSPGSALKKKSPIQNSKPNATNKNSVPVAKPAPESAPGAGSVVSPKDHTATPAQPKIKAKQERDPNSPLAEDELNEAKKAALLHLWTEDDFYLYIREKFGTIIASKITYAQGRELYMTIKTMNGKAAYAALKGAATKPVPKADSALPPTDRMDFDPDFDREDPRMVK